TQNSPAGTVLDTLGVRTVTLTADDGNGNTTECNFLVTVRDQTPPELTCPERSVIPADGNCTVTLADYRDSILVSDNCGPTSVENGALTLVQSPVVGTIFFGRDAVQQVTITATDPSGNTVDCFITVELADTTRPTIVCPSDTTLVVDDNCAATVPDYTDLAAVADNCEQTSVITVTQSPVAGTPVSDEATLLTITLTATDENGNAVSCDFAVQLIDTLPPAVVCPADDLISVDGDCEVLLPDYRPNAGPNDNCSTDINLEQRPAPGTPLSGDGTTQTVTIIATDESGNVDSCQLTVTLEDSTEPMISCPADQELTADEDCEVVIPDYTGEAIVSSACDQSTLTVTQTPTIGTTISGHNATETITLTATDGSGNSVSCSFTVILIDRSPPVITDCQRDTLGVLDESCRYVLPNYWSLRPAAAQDDCRPSDQITYTQTPPPGTVLEDAFTVTTVTLIADDGNGNTVSCDFALTLMDTLAPTIVCPADTGANPDGGCDFSLEDYTGRAVVADNCTEAGDLTVSQSPAPGTVISGQATSQEITLTVTDASGNSVDCSFTLSLQDTIAPTIDCPADKVENLTTTCDFTVPDYTGEAVTDDNCTDPAAITITQSPAAGTLITSQNEGDSFTVTLTADDGNGNTTDCSFTVTLDDAIDPVITCAADSTVFVDAACAAVLPDLVVGSSATDNCGTTTITQRPLPGEEYRGDDTQISVTLTADDGNGNTSQCLVTVTLQDTISPTIVCPPSEVLLTDGDCEVMIPDYRSRAMIIDNCTTTGGISFSQD
ncbi:MAG: HYR domain-containing protein, partial [Bacteroidota bacterium]